MEQRNIAKFQGSLTQIMEELLSGMNKERDGIEGLDVHLSQRGAAEQCIDILIEEIQKALETACRFSFRIRNK